jgi:Amt family ammonium transporter
VGALLIGGTAGFFCFIAATKLKRLLRYDDSLDVFGVHAVGGIVGAILTGVCASSTLGGAGLAEGMTIGSQVIIQLKGVVVTIAYSSIMSLIILGLIHLIIGLRVDEEQESEGLDLALHDEVGYNL